MPDYRSPSEQHRARSATATATATAYDDPYAGGYDAINYPSIPALIQHSQQQSARGAGAGGSYGDNNNRSSASYPGRAAKPNEVSGATSGNARYKCMLLPTADGADVEDVVLQVGLDGVRVYDSNGVATDGASRAFPLERVASWRTLDPTVFVVVVVATATGTGTGSGEAQIALSSDEATTTAMMDTLTTGAFQWCELRGFDPSATIEDCGGGAWANKKARQSGGGGGGGSVGGGVVPPTTDPERPAPSIDWNDGIDYCGWLSKRGETIQMWRRRWFVLKENKLAWFKNNFDQQKQPRHPRGVIDLAAVNTACTASKHEAGKAHAIELIGSADAEKRGCKFLVADSEREADAWAMAIHKSMSGAGAGSGAGGGQQSYNAPSAGVSGGGGSSSSSHQQQRLDDGSGLGSQLHGAFASVPRSGGGRDLNPDIDVSVTGYTPGGGGSGGGGSAWEQFYTNEGVAYYVNNVTGVTQWEAPR